MVGLKIYYLNSRDKLHATMFVSSCYILTLLYYVLSPTPTVNESEYIPKSKRKRENAMITKLKQHAVNIWDKLHAHAESLETNAR